MDDKTVLLLMSWLGSVIFGLTIIIYSAMEIRLPKLVWIIFLILSLINAIYFVKGIRK